MKVKKRTKNFVSKHLKQTIENRRKAKDFQRKKDNRKARRGPGRDRQPTEPEKGPREAESDDEDVESDIEVERPSKKAPLGSKPRKAPGKDAVEAAHKGELEDLRETDPEFFKFLQDNDEALLAFGDDMEEGSDEEEGSTDDSGSEVADEDQMDAAASDDEDVGEDDAPILTNQMLDAWEASLAKNKSLRMVRRLLAALKAAEQFTEGEQDEGAAYSFDDQSVVTRLVSVCVTAIPPVLDHHLPVKSSGKARIALPSASPRWTKVQPVVKSYLNHLLKVSKQFTNANLQHFLLRNFVPSIPYFACFPKLSRDLLKRLLDVWTSGDEKARISAFLAIRKLATFSSALLTLVMKKAYLSFGNLAANTNNHTWTHIQFMRDCVAELYAMNATAAYQHAFVYIRQLAITLRNAITTRTKDSYKAVYNWQYIHCLRLWGKVLANHAQSPAPKSNKASLAELIYPFSQVVLGVCRLLSNPQYFPLRFQCIRTLLDLSEATGVYVPLVPYLVEVLDSPEVTNRAKPSTMKPLDFRLSLKAQKPYLHTMVYQDGLIQEVHYLLLRFYAIHAKSIAFPELATPLLIHLKRMAKKSRNPKLSKQARMLIEKLEQNAKYIQDERLKVDFAPTDAVKASEFLATVAPSAIPVIRHLESVNKLKARIEGGGAPEDSQPLKRKVEAEERRTTKKAKAAPKRAKQVTVEEEAEEADEDEDDIVEDFSL
ncbi:Noc2p family-domain-containing protein [Hyaloraphidium curvatum]|nr:Noc2p family-domain-containing protein [Hyaloraphidium curvatum]